MSGKNYALAGVLLTVLGVGGIAAWRTMQAVERNATAAATAEARPTVVGVTTATVRTIRETVVVAGTLRPVNEADVVADVPGRVVSLAGEIGSTVQAGQVLARLEDDAFSAQVAQADAAIAAASAARDAVVRQRDATERVAAAGGVGEVQIGALRDQAAAAEAQVKQAEAARRLAATQLSDTVIRSPIAGTVTDRTTGLGRMVGPGYPLFHVMDLSALEMELLVDERVVSLVQPGMTVDLSGAGGTTATGTVRVSAPALDPRTRKAKVIVEVPATGLVPYGTATARLVLAARDGVAVPRPAIVEVDGVSSVWVAAGGKATRVTVTPGASEGELVLVDGLTEGAQVITAGFDTLTDGAAVEVASTTETPAAPPPPTAPTEQAAATETP